MSGYVAILGATSGIARAAAVEAARLGHDVILAARRVELLESQAHDLEIRFSVKVLTRAFDALDFAGHTPFVASLIEEAGDLQGVVLAFGEMGSEEESWKSWEASRRVIDSNFTGAVSVLLPLAEHFERRGSGFIVVISSVAGDRGRKKNMTYGASKAGLSVYVQGLQQRLAGTAVKLTLVKPGFVDTRMTWPLGKLPFSASPERAARDIFRAVRKGVPQLYTAWIWRWIMLAVRSVPFILFKRMKF